MALGNTPRQFHRIEVDSRSKRLLPDLRELVQYRDLFLTLAYRDLRVRYAQTALGLLWAFFQPLMTLAVLSLIFGRAVRVDTTGIPYPLFAITGITVWSYFSFVLKESGNSIIGAQEVVRKIYFPRLIIPLSKASLGLVDMLVAFLVLLILFLWYGIVPSANAWLAIPYVLGVMFAGIGLGIWVCALTIRFRDLQHVIPFFIQFGLFASPVAYPADTVKASLPMWGQVLYFLNPMAGLVEGFRWCLLGMGDPGGLCLLSWGTTLFFLFTGFIYFRRMERVVADLV